MIVFMNLVTRLRTSIGASVYFGSGILSRFGTSPLRGISLSLLRALRAVLRAALFPVGHARSIEGAANNVVANAWKVFHTAAADQADRVLLEVVALARNVA